MTYAPLYKLKIFFRQFESYQMLERLLPPINVSKKEASKAYAVFFFQMSKFFFLVTDILYIKLP